MKKRKSENLVQPIILPRNTPYGHAHPVTRREFVGQGLIAGAATVMVPSLLTLVSQRAYALDDLSDRCKGAASIGGPKAIPFLIIDRNAGATLAGREVVVGEGPEGQSGRLKNYSNLGLAASDVQVSGAALNKEFGLVFHNNSDVLRGIKSVINVNNAADKQVADNIDGMFFVSNSKDDNSTNPHNPAYWIAAAAQTPGILSAKGSLTQIVGSGGNNSQTFAKSSVAAGSFKAAFQAIRVNSFADAAGLASAGDSVAQLGEDNVKKILQATQGMSTAQIQSFEAKALSQQAKELAECGYFNAAGLIDEAKLKSPDPGKDTQVTALNLQPVAGMTPAGIGLRTRVLTIAKLVLEGHAGSGTVEQDGCDYHAISLQAQIDRSFELGVSIGAAFKLAAQKGTSLALYVITDGAASAGNDNSNNGGRVRFSSEDGTVSGTMLMVYRHPKSPTMTRMTDKIMTDEMLAGPDGNRMVGYYRRGNGNATAFNRDSAVTVDDVNALSQVILANYLSLNGAKMEDVLRLLGQSPDFAKQPGKYIGFKKIT